MASADKSRLPSSFDGRDMSNEMESAGRQNRNRSKGGRERGGERDFVTVRLEAHVRLNSTEREWEREGGRQRATAQNSKESSFSRSARVVREVEDSPAFFHGCRRQISDAAAVKISRLPCSVGEKNLRERQGRKMSDRDNPSE